MSNLLSPMEERAIHAEASFQGMVQAYEKACELIFNLQDRLDIIKQVDNLNDAKTIAGNALNSIYAWKDPGK